MKPEEQLSVAFVLFSMMVEGSSSNSWTVPLRNPKAGRPSPSYEMEMAFGKELDFNLLRSFETFKILFTIVQL